MLVSVINITTIYY